MTWPWKVPSNTNYSMILWSIWLYKPVSGGSQQTYRVVANKRFRSTWLRYKVKAKELSLTWINVSHIIPDPVYPSRGATSMHSHITTSLSLPSKDLQQQAWDLHCQWAFLHWRLSTVSVWKCLVRQKQPWPLALERTAARRVSGTKYSVSNFRHLQAMAVAVEALLISLFVRYITHSGTGLFFSLISTILT